MSDKPLLTLCMIVKNEVHTLAKTLESAKSAIDRYCILDTGSTDGTQALIRETLSGVSGELHEEPFVDFSTSRNRVLDLAGDASEFILSLDADDVLVGGARLKEYLTSVRSLEGAGYALKLMVSNSHFTTVRLFRASARWRYVGAVHELLLPPGEGSYPGNMREIEGAHIDHFPDAVGGQKTQARWERDAKLLRGELERDPKNTRACFYLARTLMDIGTLEGMRMKNLEAFPIFERRWKMGGGFTEEIFCSKLYAARCARRAGLPWNSCVAFWLAAHECDPRRIEPLADLASEYSSRDEHAQCVLFARRAMELAPLHEGALFVEHHDYLMAHLVGWHAYYVPNGTELGIAACKRAIELQPNHCAQDAKNLTLHLERSGKLKLSKAKIRALRDVMGD
jgi:glycosyltransferase involved in cell wall biosynthesis